MRTTIVLPDELYRSLKTRAALAGVTLRELVQRLIEQGLQQPRAVRTQNERRDPPPIIIPARGVPIEAVTGNEMRRIEEEEDEAHHARSARR